MAHSLLADPGTAAVLRAESVHWPSITLTPSEVCELELQLTGLLGSHDGFVLLRTEIAPAIGDRMALRNAEGLVLAILTVTDFSVEAIRGTLIGIQLPVHFDFGTLRSLPNGLSAGTVAVFADTHHPAHLPTFEALGALEAPLLFVVPAGSADLADNSHFARVRCLRATLSAFATPPTLCVLPLIPGSLPEARETIARHLGACGVFGGPQSPSERTISPDALLPAAADEFARSFPPNSRRGFTVFLTGFSGSGKSTVARVLEARLLELGGREVTLLDGDLVRQRLSSELGFSREHRNLNILRIGYVASVITKNGGAAICAPIAPYDTIRKEVRATIEPLGGFVLVHINTPLEVCEQRDVKGLYAKARAGIVKEFTGISDPYDVPEDATLRLDTTTRTAEACAEAIISHLRAEGFLE